MKAFTSRHVLKSVSTFLNCIPKLVQKLGVQNEEMKESIGKEKTIQLRNHAPTRFFICKTNDLKIHVELLLFVI